MRHKRLIAWSAVLFTFGIVVGMLPLFGVLGFELAVAATLPVCIMGLDVGAARARARQRARVSDVLDRAGFPGRSLAKTTLVAAGVTAALAAIPAIVCAIRGLWVTTCDWSFGIWAYLTLPIASAAIAGAYGHVIGVVTGPRRFVGVLAAMVPLVGLIIYGVLRFHGSPPAFTYNPLVGYFPGNLYDENVQIAMPLLWARVEQVAWLVAFGALVALRLDVPSMRVRWRAPRPAAVRWRPLLVGIVAAAGAIALHVQSGALGYAVDASDIEDELAGRVETEHFVIHYAKVKPIEDDLAMIVADHEFRYQQVTKTLGVTLPDKIHSFYFASTDQKARWIGARDVEMAKPWRHEIYLDHRGFPHPSLRHEIAHVVASEFGDELFGVSMQRVAGLPLLANPGLIEGLAVATDWPGGYDHPTPHESVRAMIAMGVTPTLDELLSVKFLSVSSARGYTTAGSFLRFLLDRYGAPALRSLYRSGGDFEGSYGRSRNALEGEWRAMIATIPIPPESLESSRERFRRGGLFSRPCPHAVAKRRERAGELLSTGDRGGAIALLRDVCDDAPDEPRFRMDLGDYLVGGTDAERAEAEKIWATLSGDETNVTPTMRAEAYERLARLATGRGDTKRVRELIEIARKLPVESQARRQLDAEAFALDYQGPAGDPLRGYFFGAPTKDANAPVIEPRVWAERAVAAEPSLGFASYLAGLQAINAGDHARGAEALDRALELGVPGIAFVKNGARKLVIAAYRTGDRARMSKAIAWLASPTMSTADHLLALDWQARLER